MHPKLIPSNARKLFLKLRWIARRETAERCNENIPSDAIDILEMMQTGREIPSDDKAISPPNDRKVSRLPARASAMTAAAPKPPGGLTIRLQLPLLRESYVAFFGTILPIKTATMLLISDKGWRWAKPPSVPVSTAIEYCRCVGGWLTCLVKMPSRGVRTF